MRKGSDDKPQDGTPRKREGMKRRDLLLRGGSLAAASALTATGLAPTVQAQQKGPAQAPRAGQRPNILFIMGDDIGWMQPSIYHRGLMVGETPNIDRIGHEGALFTDYYAEQSCTAGRCAFFTGMNPLRDVLKDKRDFIEKNYETCTQVVENEGHRFGEDLSELDKKALTAFIATL